MLNQFTLISGCNQSRMRNHRVIPDRQFVQNHVAGCEQRIDGSSQKAVGDGAGFRTALVT